MEPRVVKLILDNIDLMPPMPKRSVSEVQALQAKVNGDSNPEGILYTLSPLDFLAVGPLSASHLQVMAETQEAKVMDVLNLLVDAGCDPIASQQFFEQAKLAAHNNMASTTAQLSRFHGRWAKVGLLPPQQKISQITNCDVKRNLKHFPTMEMSVQQRIRSFLTVDKRRRSLRPQSSFDKYNMVFVGNTGVGKYAATTIVAHELHEAGVIQAAAVIERRGVDILNAALRLPDVSSLHQLGALIKALHYCSGISMLRCQFAATASAQVMLLMTTLPNSQSSCRF